MKTYCTIKFSQTRINRERKFRGSLYVDIYVPETEDIERDRLKAKSILEGFSFKIPNSYVGDIAEKHSRLDMPLDREI
jgi:hypothetical protein